MRFTHYHIVLWFVFTLGGLFKQYRPFWDLYKEYSLNYAKACKWVLVCLHNIYKGVYVCSQYLSSNLMVVGWLFCVCVCVCVCNFVSRLLKDKRASDESFNKFLELKRGAAMHTLESLMLLPVSGLDPPLSLYFPPSIEIDYAHNLNVHQFHIEAWLPIHVLPRTTSLLA